MKSPSSTKKQTPLPELQPQERLELERIAAGIRARKEELDRRVEVQRKTELAEKNEAKYRKAPASWIEDFCIILDDYGNEVPFDLYLYQREFLGEIISFEDDQMFFEDHEHCKSRQTGFSWLYQAAYLWAIKHYPNFRAKNLSRREDEVDDPGTTTESLHGKFKFMWERLPENVRPPLFFSHLKIRRTAGGVGFIAGESANQNAGRGGTYDAVLLDEAGFIPWCEKILKAVSQACNRGVGLNSTPNGKEGAFARVHHDEDSGFKHLETHWVKHPEYSKGLYYDKEGRPRSPWYDAQCKKLLPEDIASELDMDFEGSVAGKVFPEAAHGMTIAKVKYDPLLPLHMWVDYGMADPTSVIFAQIYHGEKIPELRIIAEYEQTDLVPAEHAENWRAILRSLGFKGDTRAIRGHGDPAARARSLQKKTTLKSDYRAEGFIIRSKQSSIKDGIKLCKMVLRGQIATLWVDDSCELFVKHVHGNKYPTDQNGNRKIGAEEPLNDSHNHMCAAWRYGLVNNFKSTVSAGSGPRTSKR